MVVTGFEMQTSMVRCDSNKWANKKQYFVFVNISILTWILLKGIILQELGQSSHFCRSGVVVPCLISLKNVIFPSEDCYFKRDLKIMYKSFLLLKGISLCHNFLWKNSQFKCSELETIYLRESRRKGRLIQVFDKSLRGKYLQVVYLKILLCSVIAIVGLLVELQHEEEITKFSNLKLWRLLAVNDARA